MVKKDYEGQLISFEKSNGNNVMINLTEVAKAFPDKNLSTIVNSKEMQEYISELTEIKNFSSADLLIIKKGGDPSQQGTWAHKLIALRVAQKLSPAFAIWVDEQIEELLTKGVVTTPQDYLSALKALVVAEEEKQRLELENKAMQPKAEYFDALVDRNLLTNFRDTAKELGVKERVFIDWLVNSRYLYRDTKNQLRPYATYVEELFKIKEYKARNNEHVGVQTLITPKGRETFRLLMTNAQ